MNEITTANRIKGALYGAVVGDALGLTHEFLTPDKVPDPPYEVVGGGPFHFPQGAGSDDTALLLAAIQSYTAPDDFSERLMIDRMVKWLSSDPPDVGNQTRYSITEHARGRTLRDDPDAKGNGGLMRAAAHAIMSTDPALAADNAYYDTMLTHPCDDTAEGSATYAYVLRTVIEGYNAQLAPSYTNPVADMGGHYRHSLAMAGWALNNAGQGYEAVITAIIQSGGDTDTNACIAGGLVGAALGFDAIPERWVTALRVEGLTTIAAKLEQEG